MSYSLNLELSVIQDLTTTALHYALECSGTPEQYPGLLMPFSQNPDTDHYAVWFCLDRSRRNATLLPIIMSTKSYIR